MNAVCAVIPKHIGKAILNPSYFLQLSPSVIGLPTSLIDQDLAKQINSIRLSEGSHVPHTITL